MAMRMTATLLAACPCCEGTPARKNKVVQLYAWRQTKQRTSDGPITWKLSFLLRLDVRLVRGKWIRSYCSRFLLSNEQVKRTNSLGYMLPLSLSFRPMRQVCQCISNEPAGSLEPATEIRTSSDLNALRPCSPLSTVPRGRLYKTTTIYRDLFFHLRQPRISYSRFPPLFRAMHQPGTV